MDPKPYSFSVLSAHLARGAARAPIRIACSGARSAVTMGLALAADLAPEYAILIGSIAGPLAKWADKTEREYGLGAK